MTLERAIAIAAEAHADQVDKGGEPYILHPLRVMMAVKEPADRIVAVLHDVIEDSAWGINELFVVEGFSEEVCDAVWALTRQPRETYEAFIQRLSTNPIARRVKLADLDDNSDMSRIQNPTQKDWDRARKYARAITTLLQNDESPHQPKPVGADERSLL